jgi:exodeoxyribonuclease VII large subunit
MARDLLEGALGLIWVEGELSNVTRASSGHYYFTLKDPRAQVRAALFRANALRMGFAPENGQHILARGRISLYEPRGDYQLIAEHLELAGEGALQREFERLRQQLQQEGLFDPARKRTLPYPPHRLAVLTSPVGAAIHDVVSVLRRRFPLLEIDLLPIPVQGHDAPPRIVDALRRADACGRYDALLLTRGGGSLEDLWAFNDETLARTIADLQTPLICAVGHESDHSIADWVADLRAPTPSAAAELLVPDQGELAQRLQHISSRLQRSLTNRLNTWAQTLDQRVTHLRLHAPAQRLQRGSERLQHVHARLRLTTNARIRDGAAQAQWFGARLAGASPVHLLHRTSARLQTLGQRLRHQGTGLSLAPHARLNQLARTLAALSPLAALQRGYAIARDAGTGQLLTSVTAVERATRIRLQLKDGDVLLRPDQESSGT